MLVIIGLIVGGVLVGRDLIKAAEVRATVTQIEKYNTAANTFKGKYGYLPGDIKDPEASSFGFAPRGACPGEGDGDGVIKGIGSTSCTISCGFCEGGGETAMFWVDLTSANGQLINLIKGNFSMAQPGQNVASAITDPTALASYFPQAQLGNGNFIYVWSGGPLEGGLSGDNAFNNGSNYFGMSVVTQLGHPWQLGSKAGLTVKQAYDIDAKMDDGLPQSGNVTALYLNGVGSASPYWAGTSNHGTAPYTNATSGTTSSCFDNGNSGGVQQYSVKVSGGSNINCALSFQFQ